MFIFEFIIHQIEGKLQNKANKQISYQNQLKSSIFHKILKLNNKNLFSEIEAMFSLDLDNLNILVMLILAFFSFRAYHPNQTLSIQCPPEEQSGTRQIENDQEQMQDENVINFNENPEKIQSDNLQHAERKDEVQVEANDNVDRPASNEQGLINQNIPNNNNEMQNQADGSLLVQAALKYDQADSTVNRQSTIQSDICLNLNEEQILSDSSSSLQLGSSSSQDDSENSENLNRAQKRKQIQKAKKKAKRLHKRNESVQQSPSANLVQI